MRVWVARSGTASLWELLRWGGGCVWEPASEYVGGCAWRVWVSLVRVWAGWGSSWMTAIGLAVRFA